MQWDGEDWLADKDQIVVGATFESQVTEEPEEPEEPEKKGLSWTMVIILIVIGCVVGGLLLVGVAYVSSSIWRYHRQSAMCSS